LSAPAPPSIVRGRVELDWVDSLMKLPSSLQMMVSGWVCAEL
jgi:hypothetical protein